MDMSSNSWSWVDGTEWDTENVDRYFYKEGGILYEKTNGNGNKCLFSYDGGDWGSEDCHWHSEMSYACEFDLENVGVKEKTWTFQKNNLPKDSLHFWWKFDSVARNETLHKSNDLSLKWRVENKFPNLVCDVVWPVNTKKTVSMFGPSGFGW